VTQLHVAPAERTLRRACPSCGSPSGTPISEQELVVPDEVHVERSFSVVECPRCGLVFADVRTAQEDLDEVYRDHSKYADTTTFVAKTLGPAPEPSADQVVSPWDLDRLTGTADRLAAVIAERSLDVLDAGCATGALLAMLAQRGFTSLTGLDPSPSATATASALPGVQAVTGSLFDPQADLGTFDVVVLTHVLEHLADVGGAIAALRALVRPGGLLFLEVPDANRYVDYLVAPFHDFNTEHVNHFSAPVLSALLARHGFEAADVEESDCAMSLRHRYPVVRGLWRRVEEPAAPPRLAPDPALAASIRRFVERSEEQLRSIASGLEDRFAPGTPIMLWGAGNVAMRLLARTCLADASIVALIDASPQKQGLHFAGVPVIAPADAVASTGPVVVASMYHDVEIAAVARERLGAEREIVLLTDAPA
jgi:SAM-dependent methyltransferase